MRSLIVLALWAISAHAQTAVSAIAKLSPLVGRWTGTAHVRATQNTAASQSAFSAEFRWILNERHLEGTMRYKVGGEAYESRVLFSYDPQRRSYLAYWLDNVVPSAIEFRGPLTAGKTLALAGARSEEGRTVRERLRFIIASNDSWTLTSGSDAQGDMADQLTIRAQRAK